MPAVVVVGAQWGDEGKGKVVDLYSRYADLVVRYGGGANAGHTLVVGGEKVVFHLIPSGALHRDACCVIGPGTVVDPKVLVKELEELEKRDLLGDDRFWLSDRAHLVLPHHMQIDGLREAGAGKDAIGTTKRGIGPTYEDKVARRGVRAGDLRDWAKLRHKVEANLSCWQPVVAHYGGELPTVDAVLETLKPLAERLAPTITDTSRLVADALKQDKKVLLEGAQGTMLDIDHGTYPFVTSSTVISGGACAGAGVGPSAINRVVGISKAYTTRVGGGPFPTELHGEEGDRIRTAGAEFGATTGRPRRCGWLDIPALRFAARVNGMDEIALTKLDVLSGQGDFQLCVGYEIDGERFDEPPYDGLEHVKPVLETVEGWDADLTAVTSLEGLPKAVRKYLDRIETLAECRVGLVSVGPDREQTLNLADPFA